MEIQGKIIKTLPIQSGMSKSTGKKWMVQNYVLETKEQYPKQICIEVFGDKICELDLQMGVEYQFSIDIDAREYKGRWYNKVSCWRATRISI